MFIYRSFIHNCQNLESNKISYRYGKNDQGLLRNKGYKRWTDRSLRNFRALEICETTMVKTCHYTLVKTH